jgi:hypothetical protein
MKPPVAVALIIMGTVLILAPIGADYLFQRNLVSFLTKEQSIGATVMSQLSAWYRVVCWLTGSLMVLVGALAAGVGARAGYYAEADDEVDDEDEDDGK